ncbi:hypothetical protein JHW43_007729 [Diplocarpon mali]|nr:hypothetical protein JHW43_007729 [Diplocarpon mali]
MASTGINVLRYAALGTGVFYGFYHQSKLTAASKLAAANREYEHRQNLIKQAKAEFSKKNLPPSAKTQGGDSTLRWLTFHCKSREDLKAVFAIASTSVLEQSSKRLQARNTLINDDSYKRP